MNNFLDLIVESNVFNFAILLICFVFVAQKFHFAYKLGQLRKYIISDLQASNRKREGSYKTLSLAKTRAQNIDSEILLKVKQIKSHAGNVIDSINETAKNKVKVIENNTEIFRENEINNTITEISSKMINSALEIAKVNIQNKFENNKELQDEYIEKSLKMFKNIDLPIVPNYVSPVLDVYSKALCNIDSDISDELFSVSEIVKNSKDLSALMLNPIISLREKHEVIEAVFKNKLSSETVSFLKILIDNNRFSELENIVKMYLKEKSSAGEHLNIKIISAISLNDEEKINISRIITSKLNRQIFAEWEVDKSVIGGLIFKIGDSVFDTSVSRNIDYLSKI